MQKMEEDIKKILETAVWAPSGDNSQPWRFEVEDNKISLFNIPEKDTTLYNFKQRGSYISHGALIENIIITSSQFGYSTDVKIFPEETSSPNKTATIFLNKSNPKNEPLFSFIKIRATNRKPYNNDFLSEDQKKILLNCCAEFSPVISIKLIEDKNKKEKIAKILSLQDRLILECEKIHKFLFAHIVWTEKEEKEKKSGLYAKTLELSPPQMFAFKNIFSNWRLVQKLNKIGLSKFFGKQTAKLYNSSAAIGIIEISDISNKNFILAGMVFQKIWLEITKLGLNLQPITGVAFFSQRVKEDDKEFSDFHITLIKDAYKKVIETAEIKNENIAVMFRIGEGKKPSALSSRLAPEIIFKN